MSSVRTVFAVVALLIFAGVVPAIGAASTSSIQTEKTQAQAVGATTDDEPLNVSADVRQTAVYRLLPNKTGSIAMTLRYRTGPNVSTLITYDYPYGTVVESHGFVQQNNGRWLWTENASSPSLTFEISVNRSKRLFRGYDWVGVDSWALAHPETAFAYYSSTKSEWVYPWQETDRIEQRRRVDGEGFAGSGIVYLGEHETTVSNLSIGQIRLVRPSAVNTSRTDRGLAVLKRAATQLRVGGRDQTVNVFVGPDPLRNGGITVNGANGTQDLWVSEKGPISAPGNTWIHEYVHTRQNYTLGQRMQWFDEACASYYAGLLSVRQGLGDESRFETFLRRLRRNSSKNAVLANETTWPSVYAPYVKGQRVLAALDGRIRNYTDREATLQTVFRRMNSHDGRVTYDDFESIVSNVSGASQESWLAAHVGNETAVSPPTSQYVYTATDQDSDADGDGLADIAEREYGTEPFDTDTDDDGLDDYNETLLAVSPTTADTDGDGIADGRELEIGTAPTVPDTDGDGLIDGLERQRGTDPTDPDSVAPVSTGDSRGANVATAIDRLLASYNEIALANSSGTAH